MKKLPWILLVFCCCIFSCNQAQQVTDEGKSEQVSGNTASANVTSVDGDIVEKIEKTAAEWKEELTEEEFYVLRQKGTERAFTGDLWNHKEEGIYVCAGCQLPLFSSKTKFKSGTGWPSYFQPIEEAYIAREVDNKYGWNRVEVLCARCDGHLGHVFEDGPPPTGLRYCINSVSLDFVKPE